MVVMAGTVWGVTTLVSLLTVALAYLRPSYPGWRCWAVGHAAIVLGMLVSALRTPETQTVSILLGNGLVMTGSAVFLLAFHRFGRRPPTRPQVLRQALVIAGTLVTLAALTVLGDQFTARFVLVCGYLGAVHVALTRLIVQLVHAEPALRTAYLLNMGVLVLAAMLTVPRTVLLATGHGEAMAFALNGPNVLMYLGVTLLSVGGTFAFWILHADRRRHEVQSLQGELWRQAQHDPLTALLNRRGLWSAFSAWEAGPATRVATLLVCDINEFKRINDTRGHAAGDECLRQLSAALRAVAQPEDVAGRWGGDEFVLLLTGSEAAVEAQVSTLTTQLAGEALGCTVSVGRTLVRAGEALEDAVARADRAMYASKANHPARAPSWQERTLTHERPRGREGIPS
ncbi:diguanylate cyclase [Deinococcus sp. KSM4-11]|nr:diguanylate cyclase [Deinococcus sp. KSM4-11]